MCSYVSFFFKEKGSVKEAFTERKEQFLAWLFFPILPIFMGFYFPETMCMRTLAIIYLTFIDFTNSIKPFTQVIRCKMSTHCYFIICGLLFSHLPQLKVCWQ